MRTLKKIKTAKYDQQKGQPENFLGNKFPNHEFHASRYISLFPNYSNASDLPNDCKYA